MKRTHLCSWRGSRRCWRSIIGSHGKDKVVHIIVVAIGAGSWNPVVTKYHPRGHEQAGELKGRALKDLGTSCRSHNRPDVAPGRIGVALSDVKVGSVGGAVAIGPDAGLDNRHATDVEDAATHGRNCDGVVGLVAMV